MNAEYAAAMRARRRPSQRPVGLFLAVVGLLLVGLAFSGYALAARFVLHGEVNGRTLMQSVQHQSGSVGWLLDDGSDSCVRKTGTEDVWSCDVSDRHGSGGAGYRVRVSAGTACWSARMTWNGAEGFMPRRVSGCIPRWDWSLTRGMVG
jgi:hypothetical protein